MGKHIHQINCPICNGTGKLNEPSNIPKDLMEERVKVAKALRDAKYSIREIMKIMNYKSPQSVTLLLNKS